MKLIFLLLLMPSFAFAQGMVTIDEITIKKAKETVHNFEVGQNHNYHVGDARLLAHNPTSPPSPCGDGFREANGILDDLINRFDRPLADWRKIT